MNTSALRLVSPKTLLNGLTPMRSILCVYANKDGQIGTAITDPYSSLAAPYLNTTNPQDIQTWIQERGVGGVVFALSKEEKQQGRASLSSTSSSITQQQSDLLANLQQQIFVESSVAQDEEPLDEQDFSSPPSWFDTDEATVLGCTMDPDEEMDPTMDIARRHVEQWDDAPPSASTDAAIALTRFLCRQQHR